MLASILVLSLASPPTSSATPAPPARFTGAFRGIEAEYGAALGTPNGQAIAITGRAASVLHLADVALSYRGILRDDAAHHVGVAARLHPFFLFLLANNRWGATIGAFYLELGVGGISRDAGLAATWQWGAGIDVPLLADLDHDGLWLGVGLVRLCQFDTTTTQAEEDAVTAVSLRLGWRFNGL